MENIKLVVRMVYSLLFKKLALLFNKVMKSMIQVQFCILQSKNSTFKLKANLNGNIMIGSIVIMLIFTGI
jgi:hypothetical protein